MKKRLLSIQHFLVAVILITKGFDKIQHHHSFIGWTILLLGMIILIYFIFLKTSTSSHTFLEIIIHLFESIALFLTAYVYSLEGKSFLPYVTAMAGLGFLVAAFLHVKRHNKSPVEKYFEK